LSSLKLSDVVQGKNARKETERKVKDLNELKEGSFGRMKRRAEHKGD